MEGVSLIEKKNLPSPTFYPLHQTRGHAVPMLPSVLLQQGMDSIKRAL